MGRENRIMTSWRHFPNPELTFLMLCRHVYNAAVGERREAWRMRGVSVTYYEQKAELPGIKEAMPEYGEVNSQVFQDVVQRVDRPSKHSFAASRKGETAGYPRFQGRNRYNSFTYPQVGEHGGARWTMASWSYRRLGASLCAGRRPIEGTPKTVTISREADGWYVCFSCADVPMQPLPPTGQETGIDLGIEAFATLSNGTRVFSARLVSQGGTGTQNGPTSRHASQEGEQPPRKAVQLFAKAHQTVRRQRQDFHHKTALALVRAERYDLSRRLADGQHGQEPPSRQDHHRCGVGAFLGILTTRQHAPVGG